MAVLKVVPEEDWKVMEKYFDKGTGVILVPEPSLETYFPEEMANAIREMDGEANDYDFNGDPDFYLDIVTTPHHYAVESLLKDMVADDL